LARKTGAAINATTAFPPAGQYATFLAAVKEKIFSSPKGKGKEK
jgi:hypothetical protein